MRRSIIIKYIAITDGTGISHSCYVSEFLSVEEAIQKYAYNDEGATFYCEDSDGNKYRYRYRFGRWATY